MFIKPYIEAVVNDFNVTAPRYDPFDNMLRSDIMKLKNKVINLYALMSLLCHEKKID